MIKMVIIKTIKGEIKGVQESNYQYFLGIPFAKPFPLLPRFDY